MFWFDALRSSMGRFPKAYSQEWRSNRPLLVAICTARSCTVQGLGKCWIRDHSKKRGGKKWFTVDLRQYFHLYFCRIGQRFEHNQVNVALIIWAKTQGMGFNLSCLEGQQNKLQEVFFILAKAIEGIKICNWLGIFESDFHLIHTGIWDKSSLEYSLPKLSGWAMTHFAVLKKKKRKKGHWDPKVVRDIKTKIMHHKRPCWHQNCKIY